MTARSLPMMSVCLRRLGSMSSGRASFISSSIDRMSTTTSSGVFPCTMGSIYKRFDLPVSKFRPFSTAPAEAMSSESSLVPSLTQSNVINVGDKQFVALEIPPFKGKLKPYIVKRRLNRMRTYIGTEKNIRHSPWRMALVCRFAAGMPLQDAINQLEFCQKKMAPLVQKVLIRTANLAEIRDGLQRSQLEVAECFTTQGHHLKRLNIMGRGRQGIMHHKHCHIRVVLREIDFKLRVYQAPTVNQKKKWLLRQQVALQDAARYAQERAEIEQMEAQAAAYKAKQDAAAAKAK